MLVIGACAAMIVAVFSGLNVTEAYLSHIYDRVGDFLIVRSRFSYGARSLVNVTVSPAEQNLWQDLYQKYSVEKMKH